MAEKNKPPNYVTGVRGRSWTHSLLAAQKAGATIVVTETGEAVKFDRGKNGPARFRPWRIPHGKRRFDSHDVHPVFP